MYGSDDLSRKWWYYVLLPIVGVMVLVGFFHNVFFALICMIIGGIGSFLIDHNVVRPFVGCFGTTVIIGLLLALQVFLFHYIGPTVSAAAGWYVVGVYAFIGLLVALVHYLGNRYENK